MSRRGIALLGATGSIGAATLAVARRHADRFRVAVLTAHRNAEALDRLAQEFEPDFVVLSGEPEAELAPLWTGEWRTGEEALADAAAAAGVDIVVNALVGIAGLEATVRGLRAGRRLALANKEALVTGGELVLDALRRGDGELIPVDSEHSAIHQCIRGHEPSAVRRLILTASGGPFRERPRDSFETIRPEDALAHPTWSMGAKITVDSATLANKALEVIEAHYLFGLPYERIEVVVHPSSIIHSMVEFRDGSTLAQLGQPTMEVPILYALGFPGRLPEDGDGFDPIAASPLIFEELRETDFPMFRLGVEAGRKGGEMPIAYSAANEVAVEAFLESRIGFPDIADVVAATLREFSGETIRRLADVWRVDRAARRFADRIVRQQGARNSPAVGG